MSNEVITTTEKKLPSLEELSQDVDLAFKNDQLNMLLNQDPPAAWVKEHPFIKAKDDYGNSVPYRYLPVEKIEFLLTKIFQRWSLEIVSSGPIFNSVFVHVRLKVENPIDGTFIIHDGIGASPIQVDAGSSASDLSKIKSSAVMMALPSAESYAQKDAAEKLGRLFGKDLNRNNIISTSAYSKLHERWQKGEGDQ